MGEYPEVQQALPQDFVILTRTAKLLTPWMVLATLCILGLFSALSFAVAVVVFAKGVGLGLGVEFAVGFFVVAGVSSMAYIIFHLMAAGSNEAIGLVRPPVRKLHATCFLVARIGLLLWALALILGSVCVAKTSTAAPFKIYQIIGVVASGPAFLATGILLTALESCRYPFQLPRKEAPCRINQFEDDIDALDRSGGDISTYEEKQAPLTPEKPKSNMEIQSKPPPSPPAKLQTVPVTPSLPPKRVRSRGWGEEWSYGKKRMMREDSGISLASRSSSGYMNSEERDASNGRVSSVGYTTSDQDSLRRSAVLERKRAKSVTPTSTISNTSRRSPLSTMTTAELPDLAERPTLRYSPPTMPVAPPHEWRASRTGSWSELVPFADFHDLRRSSSCGSAAVRLRGTLKGPPPISGAAPGERRRSLRRSASRRMPMPGSYVSSLYELELDDLIQKIENSVTQSSSPTTRKRSQINFRIPPTMRESPPGLARRNSQALAPSTRTLPRRNSSAPPPTCLRRTHSQAFIPCSAAIHPALRKQIPRPELYAPQPTYPLRVSKPMTQPYKARQMRPNSGRFEDATEDEMEAKRLKIQPLRRLRLEDLPSTTSGSWMWWKSWGI